jgi:hypothetical protein
MTPFDAPLRSAQPRQQAATRASAYGLSKPAYGGRRPGPLGLPARLHAW